MSDDITQTLRAVVPKMPESGTPIAWPVKVRSELLLEAAAQIERLRADNERLTCERDEARYFLKIFVHAHASNNAVPPHLEEQARKALEGKP